MIKLLIFDFDGVLEDTFDWNYEVAKTRYENLDKEEYRTWFDGNIYDHPTVKAAGEVNVLEYFELYKKGFEGKTIKQEFKDMLAQLKKKYHLVIISSIDEHIIDPYLKRSNIEHLFEQVWGYRKKMSKEEKFKDFLNLYNINENEVLFVTDTLGDIKEANKVNIPTVGVSWGYQGREKLQKGNPKYIAESIDELFDYLINRNEVFVPLKTKKNER